jgi:hypothetical protein
MWGPLVSGTSSRGIAVNPMQGRIEVAEHVAERQRQCRPPANQHVIVAGAKLIVGTQPNRFAQAPLHPVAFDRIADLPRHSEAEPGRKGRRRRLTHVGAAALAGLQHETLGRRPRTKSGCPKVRPAF